MPFGSEQWMYSSGDFYPYEIDQSLRFNDNDTAYLSRTPSTSSNQKTWTWSGWVKRGNLNSNVALFSAHDPTFGNTSNRRITFFYFSSDNNLRLFNRYYPSTTVYDSTVITNAVFTDPSAWYHVVLAFDTTEVTASDRVKIYVNGVLQSVTASGTGYPEYNIDYAPNCDQIHQIGRYSYSQNSPYDGYMAEVNFIDGQALDPTSFGEFKSGVWVPKEYEGTYGTNGFYLDFGNSGSLGADSSGNGNNWTPNNLAATDQVLDSPTNNFATLNPLDKTTRNANLSEGSLRYVNTATDSNWYATFGSIGMTSGKYYWEQCAVAIGTSLSAGVVVGKHSSYDGYSYPYGPETYKVYQNGSIYHDGSSTSYASTYTAGDIVGICVDADAREVWVSINGVFQGSPTAGTGGMAATVSDPFPEGAIFPMSDTRSAIGVFNFGQDSSFAGNKTAQGNTDAKGIGDFYYAPPAGYLALCTANLPDPAIDPAQDDVPADYFNTVLWTGDNASSRSITGVGFQPDFIWTKNRSTPYTGATVNHYLNDVVRGSGSAALKILSSNTTGAESSGDSLGVYGGATSLDADGFTVTSGSDGNYNRNSSGVTYVAWNWLADNTSGSSNTDGTITSTVSANQKAGFSIVNYNTGGSSSVTVGHGLDQTPEMIIIKNRDDASNWLVWHEGLFSTNHYLLLQSAAAEASGVTWNPTATTFQAGHNASHNWIGYCFHSVEGYSKFGSYTGNGSTDGPFIYTGFRPAFVMIKKSDGTAADWFIGDSVRSEYNPVGFRLMANLSDAEVATGIMPDLLSNGFKLRASASLVNSDTVTYIYMAFAEMPFKYSNAR